MTHGAFILARYSTENQNEDTIEVQVTNCSDWCRAHELPVLDVFADLAVSGMKETRPAYERMMAALRRGEADTVVIYDQSRMFRRLTSWFEFREEIAKLGVKVFSVTQEFVGGDLTDPSNFLTEGVTAIFNQMWVLQTQQKIKADKLMKARQGKHLGGKPALGYRKTADGYLEIEPEEAETIRLIFRRYAEGRSYSEIIDELNTLGRKTKTGGRFGKNSLHDLLHNEKYIGNVISQATYIGADGKRNHHAPRPDGGTRVDGACPAIIDRATWDTVQKKLAENKASHGEGRRLEKPQPLKGKVFCGGCGSAMSVYYTHKGTHDYAFYRCGGRKRKTTDCDMKPIRKDFLEHAVAEQVRSGFTSADFQSQVRATLIAARSGPSEELTAAISSAQSELKSVEKKLSAAVDALLDGFSSESVKHRITELEAEKAALHQRLSDLESQNVRADISDAEIDFYLRSMSAAQDASDSAILSLVTRVEVDADEIRVWTILDRGTPDSTDKLTPKNIQKIMPASADRVYPSAPHLACQHIYATMISLSSFPRPRKPGT